MVPREKRDEEEVEMAGRGDEEDREWDRERRKIGGGRGDGFILPQSAMVQGRRENET